MFTLNGVNRDYTWPRVGSGCILPPHLFSNRNLRKKVLIFRAFWVSELLIRDYGSVFVNKLHHFLKLIKVIVQKTN